MDGRYAREEGWAVVEGRRKKLLTVAVGAWLVRHLSAEAAPPEGKNPFHRSKRGVRRSAPREGRNPFHRPGGTQKPDSWWRRLIRRDKR